MNSESSFSFSTGKGYLQVKFTYDLKNNFAVPLTLCAAFRIGASSFDMGEKTLTIN
jgi:hypothetical protein